MCVVKVSSRCSKSHVNVGSFLQASCNQNIDDVRRKTRVAKPYTTDAYKKLILLNQKVGFLLVFEVTSCSHTAFRQGGYQVERKLTFVASR